MRLDGLITQSVLANSRGGGEGWSDGGRDGGRAGQ